MKFLHSYKKIMKRLQGRYSRSKQILSGVSAFNYNKLKPPRRTVRRGQNPIPLGVLSSISIIHIDPRAFDVRTDPFVHFHTSKEFISVDLCYNDLKREEKKEPATQQSQLIQYSFTAACVYAS